MFLLWERLIYLGGFSLAVASGAFFLYSFDGRLSQEEGRDDSWQRMDTADTARIISLIEQVRTSQAEILGRMDGGDTLYWIGYSNGERSCR